MLTTGMMLAYSYLCEMFGAWYSGDPYERYSMLIARPLGPYAVLFWLMTLFNVGTPQLFWWRRMRRSTAALFVGGVLIWIGMWLERFVIIAGSLNHDFLSSSWHFYAPTLVDWSILIGSIGFFAFLYLAFLRWVPFIPLSELKGQRYEERFEPTVEEDARAVAGAA
jgi:molybdopterin-containing oxidoreductase family membrane subunit